LVLFDGTTGNLIKAGAAPPTGTNTGDQNLFSTIAVSGQSNVVADSTSDTLTLAAGSNITITTNAGSDTVTIAASLSGATLADGDYGDIVVSSSGTVLSIDTGVITAAARTVIDDATTSDMRTTLGLAIGVDVQGYDAELAALAGLTSAANKGITFTGSGTAATYDLTAAALTILDDTTVGAILATIGGQPLDSDLTTIAGLTATTDSFLQSKSSAWAARTIAQVKTDLGLTGTNSGDQTITESFVIACSDETAALTTGTAKVTFRMPYAFTVTAVRASVTTAPTGGTLLTVDINEAGTSIISTKLTFDASELTTTTAATPAVISDSALADDAQMTIDIDAVGSTIAGAGLKVYIIGHQ
jgi:hypothetical protein